MKGYDTKLIVLSGILIIFHITFVIPNLNIRFLEILSSLPFVMLFMGLILYTAHCNIPMALILLITITTIIHTYNQKRLNQNSSTPIENFVGNYRPEQLNTHCPLENTQGLENDSNDNKINTPAQVPINKTFIMSQKAEEPVELTLIRSINKPVSFERDILDSKTINNNDSGITGHNYQEYSDLLGNNY